MPDYENLFNTIEELVLHHSPSGAEAEINQLLISRFSALGVKVWQDRADNVLAKIPGRDSTAAIAITAHSQQQRLDALIALEICPLAPEYPLEPGAMPVILSQDGYGIYDETLNGQLRQVAQKLAMPVQLATLSGFGSDASIAMKFGHVARAACKSVSHENTHGYEIAHLGAIAGCVQLLQAFCETQFDCGAC